MIMVIVDDNAKMRRYIRGTVNDLAQDIFEGGDGAEAIALYEQHRPEWLVIDIAMPVMDGIEATRRIRNKWPAAKIVILTVFEDPDLREEAREAGACAYLLKEDLLDLRRILAEGGNTRTAVEGAP